jgi:hypothetical protein
VIELMAPLAESEQLWLGMPLPALLALIAVMSAVMTALVSGLVKKFRTPADTREDRVVVLDASDRLIERFENLLKQSDEKYGREIAELAKEADDLKERVENLRLERFLIVSALIRVAQIARKYGGAAAEAEIQTVELPEGVSIR